MRRASLRAHRHEASRGGVNPPRDGQGDAPLRAPDASAGYNRRSLMPSPSPVRRYSECGALRSALTVMKPLAAESIHRETAKETLRFARRTPAPVTIAVPSCPHHPPCAALRSALTVMKPLAAESIHRETAKETLRFARRTLVSCPNGSRTNSQSHGC